MDIDTDIIDTNNIDILLYALFIEILLNTHFISNVRCSNR